MHVEGYVLTCAAADAVCIMLGARLAGLPAPGKGRVAAASMGGAFMSLLWAVEGTRLPGLLALPASVWICNAQSGPAPCFRATITTVFSAFLLGGVCDVINRILPHPALSIMFSLFITLPLMPLISLLPTALTEVNQIELTYLGRSVLLPAMLDSGNLLSDPLTGLPVVVISRRAAASLLTQGDGEAPIARLLNVRTAAGRARMPMLRPDACLIYRNGEPCPARVLVAIAPEDYGGVQALVPQRALCPARAQKIAVRQEVGNGCIL